VSDSPSVREGLGLAYDSAHAVAVLFGGSDAQGNNLGDTWEWSDASWSNVTPSTTSPSPRSGHAMAYDSAHMVTVVFGGNDATGPLNDVWEWDGMAWTSPVTTGGASPSSRFGSAMAYDSERQVMVLFGGAGLSGFLGDTWEWNGSAWTKSDPAQGASPENGPPRISDERLHPLVHSKKPGANPSEFVSSFDGSEFFFAEHQIRGIKILPGVAYLEMAIAAARELTGESGLALSNVAWLRPLTADQAGRVFVRLNRDGPEVRFEVRSGDGDLLHAEGKVICGSGAPDRREIDAADLRRHRLVMTPTGRRAMSRGLALLSDGFGARLARLGAAERTALQRLLEKLA